MKRIVLIALIIAVLCAGTAFARGPLGLTAIGGVEAGVTVAQRLPEHALERLFGALMILVAAQIAWRAWRRSVR